MTNPISNVDPDGHLEFSVVFTDRSLLEMAQLQPTNLNAFAQINGVGAVKLEDFGEIFLAAINEAPVLLPDKHQETSP